MITLYGSPRTSAGRCFWMLEEAGVPYTRQDINMKEKEHKGPDFLKINPNGKVPALKDDQFTLFESMAINFYIAEKYKTDLLGKDAHENALIKQWSFWASNELQPPMIEIFIQKYFMSEEKRDLGVIEHNLKKLPNLFTILDNALSSNGYLVGNRFSLAEINTGSVALIAQAIGFDTKSYLNMKNWFQKISERPAFKKYMNLRDVR